MSATVLSKLANLILNTVDIILSLSQMKITRHREVKKLAQGDSSEWWKSDLNGASM